MPTARQNQRVAAPARKREVAQRSLARAFVTFTQAAGSLEKSYAHLQSEVGRLRGELERANAELSRSLEENSRVRAFLARVLEGLPCGVLVTDSRHQLRMLNPEARRLFHLDPTWNPEPEAKYPPALNSLLSEADSTRFFSEQEWASDQLPGNRTIGISRATVEEAAEGEANTIWILRDISDQKRIAAEREAARQAHALAEVATVLAHEIRNPLGSMELFTGLLADATVHMQETRQWVTHLQAGLRSLSATVNNVLQFHSQPSGQFLSASLDRLLRETVGFLEPLARQRGLQITLENSIGKTVVAADPQRLQQVFFNLAQNAFRAMPPGGTLGVRVRWAPQFPGGVVQLDFQDEGHGIEPELLEKIFEPGFTTVAGSPGLGLSVCKKVIEQHGGSLRVESCPQQGSTFSIFLPAGGGAQ